MARMAPGLMVRWGVGSASGLQRLSVRLSTARPDLWPQPWNSGLGV